MFFKYVNTEFNIDYEGLYPYATFRALLKRHGDNKNNPKLKDRFIQECIYMFHVGNPTSLPNKKGFNEKETHTYALSQAGLPTDWIPDDYVAAALDDYVDYNASLGLEPILELRKVFSLFRKIIGKARVEIENKLDLPKLDTKDIDNLTALGSKLFDLSTQLPHKLEALSDAEKLLKAQYDDTEGKREVAGGGVVLASMDGSEIDDA
jgi:hypothetical protein